MTNYQIRLINSLIKATVAHNHNVLMGDTRKTEDTRILRKQLLEQLGETTEDNDGTWNSQDYAR